MLIDASGGIKVSESLVDLISLQGALVVGLGNWKTGECLASRGLDRENFPNHKIETAITYNSKVIEAKMRAASVLQFEDEIDDILISFPSQWHIIKLLSHDHLFLYLALDRWDADIAFAWSKLMRAKRNLADILL